MREIKDRVISPDKKIIYNTYCFLLGWKIKYYIFTFIGTHAFLTSPTKTGTEMNDYVEVEDWRMSYLRTL